MLIMPNLGYVAVGIYDLKRKKFLMRALTKVLSPDSASNPQFPISPLIPTMNILCADNFSSWLIARKVLLNVGLRFTKRIFLYFGVEISAFIILLILLVFNYLEIIIISLPPIIMASGLFYGGFLLIVLWKFLKLGAEINWTFNEHISLLMELKVKIRRLNSLSD